MVGMFELLSFQGVEAKYVTIQHDVQGLHITIKLVFVVVAVLWSMRATVPFVSGSVPETRTILAVYPLALMYVVLGWLIFIASK